MRLFLLVVLLGSGCHALLHTTDPLHEQVGDIVAIHNQHDHEGWGVVTRSRLTTEGGAKADGPVGALMLHTNRTMSLDGVHGSKLCFSWSENMSAVHGEDSARAGAIAKFQAHYAYLYFRDPKEVNDKIVWPTMAATQPLEVSAGGAETIEGETHVDHEGETRQYQDSIDVDVKLCGAVPTVPPDAKWFVLALVYPYDKEEKNRALLWQIVDEPPPAAEAPPTE